LPGADYFFEKQQCRDDRPQVRARPKAPRTRLIQTYIYFTARVKLKDRAISEREAWTREGITPTPSASASWAGGCIADIDAPLRYDHVPCQERKMSQAIRIRL
jgi:hypothetical protein